MTLLLSQNLTKFVAHPVPIISRNCTFDSFELTRLATNVTCFPAATL